MKHAEESTPRQSDVLPESPSGQIAAQDDPRIVQALEEYTLAVAGGCRPDRRGFLSRHADLGAELAECLDGLEFIQMAGPQLNASAEVASLAAETLAALSPAGAPLGDYRLLREIGRGGMGVVYEAEQLSLGRRVALKVLPFAAALDERQLQRFKNEAQAAAHLHHQNIVPVYGVGCERGVHYYAMQFIDGQTLASMIAQLRPLAARDSQQRTGSAAGVAAATDTVIQPVAAVSTERSTKGPAFFRTVAHLGVQAAEALEHAHGLGVVHRDIKPANLLVDARGNLWITDFGLAHCQSQAGLTMTGDLVGTLRYMSPEQALAQRVLVDHRTDVYSLGVTLYELLTLEPVFDGRDRQELLRQIALEEPRSPRKLNPALPADLETIILKSIAKEPEGRYGTAQMLADDLRRFLEDKPIRARRPTLAQRIRRWSRRHKPVVLTALVAAALALVLTVALMAIMFMKVRDEQTRTQVAYEAEAGQRDRAEANFRKARQAVDDYFTLVSESTLLDLPGSQPLRKELLEAALRYHQAFLEQRVEDPQLQAEVAVSYLRVAQIYYAIGASAEAVRALESGLEVTERLVREHPSSPEFHQRLAGVFKGGQPVHLGGSLPSSSPEALRALQKATSTWERFVRESPAVAGFRSDLAVLYLHIGGWQRALGQPADALVSLQKASALWEDLVREQPEPGYRAGLASAYAALGLVLKQAGRLPEANKAYGQALELSEKLAADFPARPVYQMELGNGYQELALQLGGASRYQEEEKAFRRALAIFTKLVGDFPNVPAYRERLGVTQYNLGNLLRITDRHEAETVLRQAVAVFERLSTDYPGTRSYRERLVSYYYQLSLLLGNSDRTREVEEAHRRAVALQEGLLADFPRLHTYQNRLAMLLITGPQLPEARRAIELAREAVASEPESGNYWKTLGAAHYRAGDWKAAVEALEKSMEFRTSKGQNWYFLAMAHWQTGDKEQANRWYNEAVQWMEKNRPHDEELHCLRAEAAALLGLPNPPPKEVSPVENSSLDP